MRKPLGTSLAACMLVAFAATPARAQWPVIDVQSIAELVQQIQTMRQQVLLAQSQLAQAQQAFKSMTGGRGMQLLLAGIDRNYLPTSSAQLFGSLQGGAAYPALSGDLRSALAANAVLSPVQLNGLAPGDRQQIVAARQSAALRQSVAQEALSNSSNRFASIQTLIGAIGGATDQKAILDLAARISAELAMLQNEQTKLQVLAQTLQAQDAVNALRDREQAVAEHGVFASRFQPTP